MLSCDYYNPFSLAGPMAEDQSHPEKKVLPEPMLPTTLRNLKVDSSKRSLEKETELPTSYKPSLVDVICGNRGSKETYKHAGNERYRVVIEMRLVSYSRSTRKGKSDIVKEIVDVVREYGGRFVRHEDGRWVDIGNLRAREKTGHAIRAALQKQNIPFRDDSSIASGTTSSKSPIQFMPPRHEGFEEDDPTGHDSGIDFGATTTEYLSSLANAHGHDGDDHEPLPLESAFSFLGKRDVPGEKQANELNQEEFLDYERVKRQRRN